MSDRFTTAPLSALYASENVRKVVADESQDKALRASIEAHGLLENLVVRDPEDSGRFAVHAGGRRLAVLQELAKEGKIPEDHPVPIRILNGGHDVSDVEASLAENVIRADMHIADQVEAIFALRQNGMAIREVGRRFGVSERRVKQFSRLGGLAHEVLEASRAGKLSIEELQAFGASNDQDAHRKVLEEVLKEREDGRYNYDMSSRIRNALTQDWERYDSRLGRFIQKSEGALDKYQKAGGRIERDLFDSSRRFRDPAILREIAADIVHTTAIERFKDSAWAWFDHTIDELHKLTRDMQRLHRELRPKQPEEVARHDELTKRLNAIEDDESEAGKEMLDEFEKLDDLFGQQAEWTPEQMKRSGFIVGIGWSGDLQIEEGLVRPEDQTSSEGEGDDGESDGEETELPRQPAAAGPIEQAKEAGLGAGLNDRMIAVRGRIVRQAIAGSPAAALDILAFTLARRRFGQPEAFWNPPLVLRSDNAACGFDERQSLCEGLPMGWLLAENLTEQERFVNFCELSKSDRMKILAAAVATEARSQLAFPGGGNSPALEILVDRLRIPFAKRYRPDTEYFEAMQKKALLALATDVLGEDPDDDYPDAKARAKLKKGELVALMTDVFASPQKWVKPAVEKWTPPGFLRPPEPEPEPEEEGDEAAE